jgi:hypothetical protein
MDLTDHVRGWTERARRWAGELREAADFRDCIDTTVAERFGAAAKELIAELEKFTTLVATSASTVKVVKNDADATGLYLESLRLDNPQLETARPGTREADAADVAKAKRKKG